MGLIIWAQLEPTSADVAEVARQMLRARYS